jgi:hypothetical protein
MYHCPKCGGSDDIQIVALVTVRLIQSEKLGTEGSEPVDSDHEWTEQSAAWCGECNWSGKVVQLAYSEP